MDVRTTQNEQARNGPLLVIWGAVPADENLVPDLEDVVPVGDLALAVDDVRHHHRDHVVEEGRGTFGSDQERRLETGDR